MSLRLKDLPLFDGLVEDMLEDVLRALAFILIQALNHPPLWVADDGGLLWYLFFGAKWPYSGTYLFRRA